MPALLLPTSMISGAFAMRSLRFNSADSAYVARTFAGAPASTTKQTFSVLIKRGKLGTLQAILGGYDGSSAASSYFGFAADDTFTVDLGGAAQNIQKTSAVFRDVGAWYHICLALDTSQAAAGDRYSLQINGVSHTLSGTMVQNAGQFLRGNANNKIGSAYNHAVYFLDALIADFVAVDNQKLTYTSFTETDAVSGQIIPKSNPTSDITIGTNGFWLSFDNNASTTTLGYDDAGGARGVGAGSNDWTLNNLSVTAGVNNDSLADAPINFDDGSQGRGNFCTLNPAFPIQNLTISDGALRVSSISTVAWRAVAGTHLIPYGKWYWTVDHSAFDRADNMQFGVARASAVAYDTYGASASAWLVYRPNGTGQCSKINNGSATAIGPSHTVAAGDVYGVAVDTTGGDGAVKIWFQHRDGTWLEGDPAAGTGASFSNLPSDIVPMITIWYSTGIHTCHFNFGQRAFGLSVPTGFKGLCAQHFPTPTIIKPNQYFDAVAYNLGGVGGNVTSFNFQPDLVWIKSRANATGHRLVDAVRGVTKSLATDSTGDEATEATGLTAFLSNGFTLGTDADYNPNAAQVAWCWKESATPGFDIVTYTGNGSNRTIAHNLGVVPKLIIVKARTTAGADQGWPVYHASNTSAPETDYLLLNSTAATADDNTFWNDTAPTSSVFSVGTNAAVNTNGDTYVAYLFAEVPEFSKFGSYTGNASADGPFVWCGLRPRFILIKRTDTTSAWFIHDAARNPTNFAPLYELYPYFTSAEGGSVLSIDILSSGFKLRDTDTGRNASGGAYVFAAFAEAPFKYARAR